MLERSILEELKLIKGFLALIYHERAGKKLIVPQKEQSAQATKQVKVLNREGVDCPKGINMLTKGCDLNG